MNLEFDPTNVLEPSDDELARDLWKRGDLAGAETLYADLLRRRPRDARLLLDAGRLSDELGRSGEAVERLRRAITAAAGQALLEEEAQATLATVLMHRGAFGEAGWIWWRIARQGVDRARGWAGLAICAHFTGQARLVKRCQRKLEASTSRQERRRLLAELWIHGSGTDLDLRPRRPSTAAGRSPLVRMLREASRSLRSYATRHPDRADAQFHLAVCCEALGEHRAAAAAVDRSLQINPRYAAARAFQTRLAA